MAGSRRRLDSRALWILAAALLLSAGVEARAGDFSAREVYRSASPSVVMVYARTGPRASTTGTGSIISADGLVLTSGHVVSSQEGKAAQEIAVFFKPAQISGDMKRDLQKGHRAKIAAYSERLDLALLEVEGAPPAGAVPLVFASSERVEIGAPVAAIGHPGGGGLWTLTTGTISSRRKRDDLDVFQTDAAINPGNSGGPLLDAQARLIGVNTFVVRMSDSGLPLEGLNYSLRGDAVRDWLQRHGVAVATTPRAREAAAARAAEPPSGPVAVEPTGQQPEVAPPSAGAPAPTAPAPDSAPPGGAQAPRAFTGPDGEEMFGVPDRSFSREKLENELYQRARRNAAGAFRELDAQDPDAELDLDDF
jgi:S1-C subfamily serine protease